MNTEILKGLKEYVFALYIGQPLAVTSIPENINYPNYPFDENEGALFLSGIVGNSIIVRRIAEDVRDRFSQCSLQLRSLSSITDSEAIEVAKLQGVKTNSMPKPHFDLHSLEVCLCPYSNDYYDAISVLTYQYLQQKGFALPIFFQGKLFSVEQLTEMQIYKIIE